MKRIISFALCLVMCITLFGTNTLTAFAATSVTAFFDVTSTCVENDEISYVVRLKPNVERFNGTVLKFEFDDAVLEVKEATPVYVSDDSGNTKLNMYGEYAHGFVSGKSDVYALAYMCNNGITTKESEYKAFFKITFRVIAPERPTTDVNIYCEEFSSNDSVDNEIRPSDVKQIVLQSHFSTLEAPKPVSAELLESGILFTWSQVPGAQKYVVLRKASNSGDWVRLQQLSEENTSYLDTDVESGVTYTYTVRSGNGYGESTYYTAGVKKSFITHATINLIENSDNKIKISWGAVNGATSYAVYRQTEEESQWKLLGKVASTKLTYEDADVENGKIYKYTVAAENEEVVSIVGAEPKSFRFFLAPSITAVKNAETGIEITWGEVEGAEGYQIYRKNDANVDWNLLTTVEETSYLDEAVRAGTVYHYAIKTLSDEGSSGYGPESGPVTRLLTPEVLELESAGDGVIVKWSQVEGATGYNIYRKARGEANWQNVGNTGSQASSYKDTSIEGGYYTYGVAATASSSESLIGTIFYDAYFLKSPTDVTVKNLSEGIEIQWKPSLNASYYIIKRTVNGGAEEVVAEVAGTSYIDKNVTLSSVYAYSVTAVDVNGWGSVGNEFTPGLKRVIQPRVTGVVCNQYSITVTWELLSNVEGYRLYRRVGNGSWTQIPKQFKADESNYEDTAVMSGEKYTYAVVSVVGGAESALDEGFAKSVTFVNRPTAIKAASTTTGVELTWEGSANTESFVVYKRVAGRVAWEELARVDNSDKATKKSVVDNNVESGVTYEYAMRGIVKGAESNLSDIATILYLDKVTVTSLTDVAGGVKINWAAVKGAKNYLVYRRLVNGKWEIISTLASNIFTYTDKTAESGKTYVYTIRALNNGYRGSYENKQIFYLAAPKITKFDSQVGKGITIKWADVHGADEYYVYRKTGDSSWKKIGTTDNLLYVDKNVNLGQTYYYTLKANGRGVTSKSYSGWKRQYTPGTPVATSVKMSKGSATIKWNAVTQADGYVIYKKVGNATKWSRLATVKGTSYVDKKLKSNTKYTYTIRSYKGKVYSEYNKTGWSVATLSTPTVKIANASAGVKVTWSKNSAATGYTVYRSQYNEDSKQWSSWKAMGTAKASKNAWVDKSASSGKIYRYTVRTVCGNSKSAYKASNTLRYLKQPSVSITNATTGMTVKWSKSTGATGYKIYRSELSGGSWTSWKAMGTAGSTKTSWTDKSVTSGTTYKYTVRAAKGSTLSSYTASKAVKYVQTPKLISAVKTDEGIVLNYGMVPGVEGYRIYRKTNDTSWVTLANVKGTQNVEYIDKNIAEDVEYTYTVRAYSGSTFSAYNTAGITCK